MVGTLPTALKKIIRVLKSGNVRQPNRIRVTVPEKKLLKFE